MSADSVIEALDAFQSEAELKRKGDPLVTALLASLLAVKKALTTDAYLFTSETTSQSHNRIREHLYLCVACCQLLLSRLEEPLCEKDYDDGTSQTSTTITMPIAADLVSVDMARCIAADLASCIHQLKSALQLNPAQQERWLQQRTTRSMLQWIGEQHLSLASGSDHLPSFASRLTSFPFLGPILLRCRSALESVYRTAVTEPRNRLRDELEAKQRSQLIDQQLAANRGPEAVSAIVIGSGTAEMPNCLLHTIDAFKEADQDIPLELLKKAVTCRMRAILQIVHEMSPENLLPETKVLVERIRDLLPEEAEIVDEYTALIFEHLWNSAPFRADRREKTQAFLCTGFPNLLDVVLDNLCRIWEPGYAPSLLDRVAIRQYQSPRSWGRLRMSTIDTVGRPPVIFADGTRRCCQRKSIFRIFDPSVVIFVLDLTMYNTAEFEGSTQRPILQAFEMFRSLLNYKTYADKPFVVLLTGITEFKAMLRHVPLAKALPDYNGRTDDTDAAVDYILNQLLAINVDKRVVYHLVCDIYDPELVPHLAEVVREADLATEACRAPAPNRLREAC